MGQSNNDTVIFDIEANGYLKELDSIHCICLQYERSDRILSFSRSDGFEKPLEMLASADILVGHNIDAYDIPALQKVFPSFKPKGLVRDTLVMSRLQRVHQMFQHSLASWGELLGEAKADYQGGFDEWSQEMQDYCVQDVKVNAKVWKDLKEEGFTEESIKLEHEFARIMQWQMTMGVPFDEERACMLAGELIAIEKDMHADLTRDIPTWKTPFTPKRNNKTVGYVKGLTVFKESPFNPGSRTQVVKYFKQKYKWSPVEFTDKGNPKISGEILRDLPYPEAKGLADYFDVKKLLGQVVLGDKAWLKSIEEGRIHGFINHNGAVTGRCTHSSPNLGQVPRVSSFKGAVCRGLFQAEKGSSIVGCDAKGLELRNLAHYMAAYDGGKYSVEVVEGDVHTRNGEAANITDRDAAKRFIYAHNYGAGDAKLGIIIDPDAGDLERKTLGRLARTNLMIQIPALKYLIDQVKVVAKQRGYLVGLDGRKLWVRSPHRALNTLLQGAGSVIMKAATVIKWKQVIGEDLDWRAYMAGSWRAYPMLHVHDETQDNVKEDYAEEFAQIANNSITLSGKMFDYRCPLEGDAKIGNNWAETH